MKIRNLLSILFLSFGTFIYAQMTALDVAKIQTVTSATIAESGDFIIYTLSVPVDPLKENKPSQTNLYLYDIASKESRPLVTSGSVRGVSLRPNHNSITFLNRRDGDEFTSLYELKLNGGEAQNIYAYSGSIASYQWNADGTKIVFLTSEGESPKGVLPFEPTLYEQNLKETHAYIASLEEDDVLACQFDGNVISASWSPDDRHIAAYVSKSSLVDDYYMTQRLKVVDAQSGQLKSTIDHDGKKGSMAWSPDGNRIAFIAGANLNDPIDGRIFVAEITGTEATNIHPDFKGQFHDLTWKDNQMIRYLASEGVWSNVGEITSDGKMINQIIPSGGPDIQNMSWSSDGQAAFVASSPAHPAEVFFMPAGQKPTRVTHHNPWLQDRKLAKQEVIQYKAADGLEIEGLLVYPLEYEAGQKYPVIHYIHGGPEAHENNGWLTSYSRPGQVAATKGMAVFYPNYRGSTGRGLEYTLTSQADPAGKEFDDIVDGSKHLINIGLADPDKVGVTGGSYGGYATGWMSTRYSDHFAAGVMFVGISNKVSKWGTTDIPKEEYLVHARKWIWEDYDFYLKRSPIYYADHCKTPLLIMHGAEDPRVHPSQSMELYRHVKERTDTPVSLVFYPGEGHGNRNASARLDYNIRSLRWFEKYLQDKDVDVNAPVLTNEKLVKP